MIPESFIEELKLSCDVESVIGSYVQLRRRGRTLTGLCPFHSEKTPSFTVYTDTQSYYCFGCGAGGDVVNFIRRMENLEYVEAVRFLAQRAGLELPDDAVDDRAALQKTRVLGINRESARFFHAELMSERGAGALKYLTERGLSVGTIRHFGLGYSPPDWDALYKHLKSKGFDDEDMVAAAMVRRKKNGGYCDVFRDRAMFPIIDLRGNVIGFGGRRMAGDGPKYYNSPDTPVFKKTKNLFALNFAKAKKLDYLILCEGYMDVIAMHQAGFTCAVASLGTALTGDQCRLAASYTEEAVLAYDSDDAGQKATKRAISLLSDAGVRARVLQIPDAKDPDEYIKKFGGARFARLVDSSAGALEYELAKIRAKYSTENEEGRLAVLRESAALLAGLHSPLERDIWAGKLAEEFSVGKDALMTQINMQIKRAVRAAEKREAGQLTSPAGAIDPVVPEKRQNCAAVTAEERLVSALMRHPDRCLAAAERVGPEDFVSVFHRRVFETLAAGAKNGEDPSPKLYGGEFTLDEQGRISRLNARARELSGGPEEIWDAIKVMKERKAKKSDAELRDMSPAELSDYLKKLRSKKL